MHRPYQISQSWIRVKYDPEKRKSMVKPVFYMIPKKSGTWCHFEVGEPITRQEYQAAYKRATQKNFNIFSSIQS